MLIGNYSVLNKTAGRWMAGGSTAGTNQAQCRSNWNIPSDWRKFSSQDASAGTVDSSSTKYAARPQGAYQPEVYNLPNKAGAMTAHNRSFATMTGSASGTQGVAAVGSTTLSMSVTGSGALIVSGVGNFTVNMSATADILAALLGVGSFTVDVGTGTSTLDAKGNIIATSTLSVTVDLTAYATGALAGDWTADYGAFTPEVLASAVWNALTADYAVPATMGAAMAAAGSAGDPWSTTLPGAYVAGQAGHTLSQIKDKADSMTFTVSGKIDANITNVNGSAITGSGTEANPWGP